MIKIRISIQGKTIIAMIKMIKIGLSSGIQKYPENNLIGRRHYINV